MKDLIRKTQEFKDLRAKAREAIAAFEDGADFDFTIDRLAAIGENMDILLGCRRAPLDGDLTYPRRGRPPRFCPTPLLSARGFFCGLAVRSFCSRSVLPFAWHYGIMCAVAKATERKNT